MAKKLFLLFIISVMLLSGCRAQHIPNVPTGETSPSQPESEPHGFYDSVRNALSQEEDHTQYAIQLTEDQARNFSGGQFILLQHFGGDQYLPFYTSNHVTLDRNTLRANFNGKVPYITDSSAQCRIPTVEQCSIQDGKVYYKMHYRTGNYETVNTSEKYAVSEHTIHMVFDQATGKLQSIQSLAKDEQPQQDVFSGSAVLNGDGPYSFIFPNNSYYQVTKDNNGNLLPFPQWDVIGTEPDTEWSGNGGMYLAYGRLSEITTPYTLRDIYMVFLITGKDDSIYGSELLPVTVLKDQQISAFPSPSTYLQWSEEERLLLTEQQGVAVYLLKVNDSGNESYDIEIKNDNPFPVTLYMSDLMFNEHYWAAGPFLSASPQSWGKDEIPIRFPIAAAIGELGNIEAISMNLRLTNNTTKKTLWENKFDIRLNGSATIKAFSTFEASTRICEPYKGFLVSQEQLLLEEYGVKISVLKVGKTTDSNKFSYLYRVENTSDEWRNFVHNGVDINGTYHFISNSKNLLPGEIYYTTESVNKLSGIEEIGKVRFSFGIEKGMHTYTESMWYDINPQQASQNPSIFPEGQEILLEENGLRVSLKDTAADSSGNKIWTLAIVNTTDRDISIKITDPRIQDMPVDSSSGTTISSSVGKVGAQQSILMDIKCTGSPTLSCRLSVTNMDGNQFLFITENQLQLS